MRMSRTAGNLHQVCHPGRRTDQRIGPSFAIDARPGSRARGKSTDLFQAGPQICDQRQRRFCLPEQAPQHFDLQKHVGQPRRIHGQETDARGDQTAGDGRVIRHRADDQVRAMGQDFSRFGGPAISKLGPPARVAHVLAPARDRNQPVAGAQRQGQLRRARGQGNDAVKHGFILM